MIDRTSLFFPLIRYANRTSGLPATASPASALCSAASEVRGRHGASRGQAGTMHFAKVHSAGLTPRSPAADGRGAEQESTVGAAACLLRSLCAVVLDGLSRRHSPPAAAGAGAGLREAWGRGRTAGVLEKSVKSRC